MDGAAVSGDLVTSRVPPSLRMLKEQRTQRWLDSTFPGAMNGRLANAQPSDRSRDVSSLITTDGALAGDYATFEFENEDIFDLVSSGEQVLQLTYLPDPRSVHVALNGIHARKGADWSIDGQTLTLLAAMDARVDDVVTVEYAYVEGMPTTPAEPLPLNIPFQAAGWSYAGTTSPAELSVQIDPATDFSSWAVGSAPLGWNTYVDVDGHAKTTSLPAVNTGELGHEFDAVIRRLMPPGADIVVTVDETNFCDVWADTTLIASSSSGGALKLVSDPFDRTDSWHLIVRITSGAGITNGGVDIKVEGLET